MPSAGSELILSLVARRSCNTCLLPCKAGGRPFQKQLICQPVFRGRSNSFFGAPMMWCSLRSPRHLLINRTRCASAGTEIQIQGQSIRKEGLLHTMSTRDTAYYPIAHALLAKYFL